MLLILEGRVTTGFGVARDHLAPIADLIVEQQFQQLALVQLVEQQLQQLALVQLLEQQFQQLAFVQLLEQQLQLALLQLVEQFGQLGSAARGRRATTGGRRPPRFSLLTSDF